MTTQSQASNHTEAPSTWQNFQAWFAAFEQAMDYDPQEYTRNSVTRLSVEVAEFRARLNELEKVRPASHDPRRAQP